MGLSKNQKTLKCCGVIDSNTVTAKQATTKTTLLTANITPILNYRAACLKLKQRGRGEREGERERERDRGERERERSEREERGGRGREREGGRGQRERSHMRELQSLHSREERISIVVLKK